MRQKRLTKRCICSAFKLAFLIGLTFQRPAYALDGSDIAPGSACSIEDAVTMTANPGGAGAYILTCESGVWVASISAQTPTADDQVATKLYTDTTLSGGSGLGGCTNDSTDLCALEAVRSNDDPQFTAANIVNGTNILGVTGSFNPAAADCQDNSSTTCTLEATRSNDDPQLVAGNIKNGVNILGVTGTYSGTQDCIVPASCPNIGDVCADGSLFAGFMLYGGTSCEPIYMADTPMVSLIWGPSDSSDDIIPDSVEDGQLNVSNLQSAVINFPSISHCDSGTWHGKSDWYFPAILEAGVLMRNSTAINANAVNDIANGFTTSSTESYFTQGLTQTTAYRLYTTAYAVLKVAKSLSFDVYCVRRD